VKVLRVLVRVLLVVALLWFGWRVYVNATGWLSAQSRLGQVSDTWQGNEAARKAAAGGSGQIASGLQFDPSADGYNRIDSWTADSATITVSTIFLTCYVGMPLQLDVRESRDVVTLLVREQPMWLPDRQRLFEEPCADVAVPTTVTATLKAPVGERIVVDAATGQSLRG